MNLNSIPERAPDVISRRIDHEAVLVHPARGRVQVLNPVGAGVWELVDGRRTVAEMAARIAADYGALSDAVGADVLAFCEDLALRGLISIAGHPD